MGLKDFFSKGKAEPAKPQQAQQPQNQQQGQPSQPQPTQNQSAPQASDMDTYTIKSGDSLSKIAKQYYGDMQQWHKIYEANKDQIKDPNLIYPGQTLKIPRG